MIRERIENRLSRVFPDPRVPVFLLLVGYLVLGFTVLGFNRSPTQVLVTALAACALEMVLSRVLEGKVRSPFSALITSCGLSLLLNYSHSHTLLLIPVFAAIGSKYVFTWQGRHVYNPAMFGVIFSLFFSRDLITAAPAYQWNGIASMAYFLLFGALMLFMPRINRLPLVSSFLVTFTLLTALRAWIMRHHLPFETLFWGTLSSPSFLLFTFYMITDPKTSPSSRRDQIYVGIALAAVDLLFHLFKSYYTFFYAAFTVATVRYLWAVLRSCLGAKGRFAWLRERFVSSGYWRRPAMLGLMGLAGFGGFRLLNPAAADTGAEPIAFAEIPAERAGIHPKMGNLFDRLDPRVQHVAKWLLSIGDSVAVADVDQDGRVDLFFTFPLKADDERCSLYLNRGDFRFERLAVPALASECSRPEIFGIPTNAVFEDIDGDGDADLLVTRAFGKPLLLKNLLSETGRVGFVSVGESLGLRDYRNAAAATFLDVNRDGHLDLFVANVLPEVLPDYSPPEPLNFFHLPQPQYPGDRRMHHYMHQSWNNAANGGRNDLYLGNERGGFDLQDPARWDLNETRWSLAVGAADFNRDGWTDLYVANDFGPDDLYLNVHGERFQAVRGPVFGSIGRDTYKGMNVSVADYDRNGWLDVYVSNVHHDLQAEGSLLWLFGPSQDPFQPLVRDRATQEGALNERRFGWGGVAADFNNDGWADIAQANGMVDDSIDKRWDRCPDYWYVNEKIARSPPSIHAYADAWGDLRGMCIHGTESNRLYLNRGPEARPRFVDVAARAGLGAPGNSRGMADADLDNDGRMDLIVTHMFQAPTIYRNVTVNPSRHWIRLTLEARASNCPRSALGSRVTVSDEARSGDPVSPQVRELQPVNGFNSQGDPRLHFGLGDRREPVTVSVEWCGGKPELFTKLAVDRAHHLVQGAGEAPLKSRGLAR
jgi:Na+-translocating ferredoxin:NAD+ oxidoreductase RnfD subunit